MTYPNPDPAFRWLADTCGQTLRCEPLAAVADHRFTTRQLPLRPAVGGAGRGSTPGAAWTQAAAALGAPADRVMRVRQVHGRAVRIVPRAAVETGNGAIPPEADAVVSDAPGVILAVQVADCVPVLLADRRRRAAGAVHAGWRGTRAGVTSAAVQAMIDTFGTDPADLVAAIGPSIGRCCYEVGVEVRDAFRADGASIEQLDRWFEPTATGWRLDLWQANLDQLLAAGVPSGQVFLAGLCTKTHARVFESFRADGAAAGRMAAAIRVPGDPTG